jgi:hypothetical protein
MHGSSGCMKLSFVILSIEIKDTDATIFPNRYNLLLLEKKTR